VTIRFILRAAER